jgi:Ca2+-binding RTX toxin-like protein
VQGGPADLLALEMRALVGEHRMKIRLTKKNDFYVGGPGNEHILGLGGNDTIYGAGGNDTLEGGAGYDVLYGGEGNDLIKVGSGPAGQPGNEGYGGAGSDTLIGGSSNDRLVGGDVTYIGSQPYEAAGDGNDSLFGGGGNDVLYGCSGDDTVDGGTGNDAVSGGAGNDILFGGDGDDYMSGDSDDLINPPGVLDNGDDFLDGGAGNDYLAGDAGDDTLVGGAGNDTLVGGAGNDVFRLTNDDLIGPLDIIVDFTRGEDLIDLREFDWLSFTGSYNAGANRYELYFDTDGLPGAEFALWLNGITVLGPNDFLT